MKPGQWVYNTQTKRIGVITASPTPAVPGVGVMYFDEAGPQMVNAKSEAILFAATGRTFDGFQPVFRIETQTGRLLLIIDLISLWGLISSIWSKEKRQARKAALNAWKFSGQYMAVANQLIHDQRKLISRIK